MNTKLLNRLLAIRGVALTVMVSLMLLATFSSPASAQTPSSSDPAKASAEKLRNTFVHLQTGFPLTGAHLTVACETCHMGGIFKGTPRECAKCHTVGRLMAATPKHQDHIQTDQPCDSCHVSTASFQLAIMNHTGITQSCFTCHNGSNSAIRSKSANHIVTNSPCENCHKTTVTFLGAGFNHIDASGSPIQGNCATCHNGTTALGKPAGTAHISTTAACETCHTSTTSFMGATFNHPAPLAACSSCHSGQQPGVKTKIAAHIPTAGECSNCHLSTVSFLGAVMSHTGITTGCASCHGGQYAGVMKKPTAHISTTAACETCHLSTVSFLGAVMNHTGITTGCASCHGGQFASVVTKPGTHLVTTADCGTCHKSTITFLSAIFNHAAASVAPGTCQSCHEANPLTALGKPSGHLVTANPCDTCHTNGSYTSFLITSFNHSASGIPAAQLGSVSCGTACHGGGPGGTPKPANHVPASATDCYACHKNTTSFLGAVMSHAGITTGCASCHDSTYAGVVKKPSTHIVTAAACETCHTSTVTFTAWTMNHTGVPACLTCHGGSFVGVLTKSASHIPTTASPACETCHSSTVSFLGAVMIHTNIFGGCETCHNGTLAMGKPGGHVATASSCTTCHLVSFVNWLGATGGHSSTSAGAAFHNCISCHFSPGGTGRMYTNPPHIPATGIQCDVCHTGSFASVSFLTSTMDHVAVTGARCDSCHNGSYTSQGTTGAKSKTSITNHIPTAITGAGDCSVCHSGTTNWTTLNSNTAIHNGAQGGGTTPAGVYCVNCHLSGVTYMGNMQKKSHNGASTAKDCSMSGCHKPRGSKGIAYSTWN